MSLARRRKLQKKGTLAYKKRMGSANRQNLLSALGVIGWGLPDRFKVKLRFTDYITFTQASGAYSEVFYRLIGPYDPRVAAGGDYPAYYSQLSALYQYQRVLHAKAKIMFLTTSTAAAAGGFAEGVVYPSTTTAGVTGMNDAIDKRSSRLTSISYYQNPPQANQCNININPAKHLGMTYDQYINDDTTKSLVGALPTKVLYLAIGTQVNDVSTTASIACRINITYTIEFMGLVPIDTVDSAND